MILTAFKREIKSKKSPFKRRFYFESLCEFTKSFYNVLKNIQEPLGKENRKMIC